MKTTYVLREDTAYGITALGENGEVLESIPCVHLDRDKAENFVSLCNSEKLELVHLKGTVQDEMC